MVVLRRVWVGAALLLGVASGVSALVPPVIRHPGPLDADRDLVLDRLAGRVAALERTGQGEEQVPVEVVLYEPYRAADLALFEALGGTVVHTFEAVGYGFAGPIPARSVTELARRLGASGRLCVIADDPPMVPTLDVATQQARIRPGLWSQGFDGGATTTIAVVDTGLDDSHPDFAGRISPGWVDTTAHAYPSPVDVNGHGTHVASIALGSGASVGVGAPGMRLVTTTSGRLSTTSNYGTYDNLVARGTGVGALELELHWLGTGSTWVHARDPSWSWIGVSSVSSTSPNVTSYDISTPGTYRPIFGNSTGAGNAPYVGREEYPYAPVGDGYPIFRGVASGCTVLGVKVLLDTGSTPATDVEEGLDYVLQHRDDYNIRVVNLSLGEENGVVVPTMDDKVNTLVANGIVVVASAGNDFPTYTIGSPANAARVITVGAVNDAGAMTNYSSNGFSGQGKPDVVASGGSTTGGTKIVAAESNDGDSRNLMSDLVANDYTGFKGTSMSAPLVSGLAALLIDVQEQLGDPWQSTEAEALAVKGLILMTATETNLPGEMLWNGGDVPVNPSGNDPTLDRGGADAREGFGQVNADAAVQALTDRLELPAAVAVTLGSDPASARARAWWFDASAAESYSFGLDVPPGADLDLFVYQGAPDADGRPVIGASSTTAGAADERITGFSPPVDGRCYLVVKAVSGSGTAELEGLAVLFEDGFESGTTVAWSQTVP